MSGSVRDTFKMKTISLFGNRSLWLIWGIIWIFGIFLYFNGLPADNVFDMQHAVIADNVVGSSYEVSADGKYYPVTEDPQMYFDMSQVMEQYPEIRSLRVEFEKPLAEELSMEVYYLDANADFDEDHCVRRVVPAGASDATIYPICSRGTILRVDFNGTFYQAKIYASPDFLVQNRMNKNYGNWGGFILFSAFLAMLPACFIRRYCESFITFCKKNKRAISIFVFGVSGLIVAAIIVKQYMNYMRVYYLCAAAIIILGIYLLRNSYEEHIECLFALIASTVGMAYALSMPMLMESTWDSAIHFVNTSLLAHIFDGKYYDFYNGVGHLPYSFNLTGLSELKNYYNTYAMHSEITYVGNINLYSSVGYIPAAIGMFIAEGLRFSFVNIVLMGKVFNLIFYVAVITYAIRTIKVGKLVIALIALYPTNIVQASTYSYDIWVTSFMILGLTYVINLIVDENEKMTLKNAFIILFSFFIGVGPKAVYFPLMYIALFIPGNRFASKKRRIFFIGATVMVSLVIMASFLTPMFISQNVGEDLRGGSDINGNSQMEYIFSYPLEYTKTLLNYTKGYLSYDNSLSYMCFIGYNGGYVVPDGNHYIPGHFIVYLLSIIAILHDGRNDYVKAISWKLRLVFVILSYGTVCIVATVFYLIFTSVGADTILGCQGRYFLPILPFVAVALIQDKITVNVQNAKYSYLLLPLIMGIVTWSGGLIHIAGLYYK